MMKMISIFSTTAVFVSITLGAAQAAETMKMQGGMQGDVGMQAEEELTFGEPAMASQVDRTITVTLEDIAYDLKHLDIKNGETIRFIIANKDEVEHEFTLGTAENQALDRAKMAQQAEMGMSMEMHEPNSISVADLQTKELIWKFKGPEKIEFACNVPGHYEAGMKGDIVITN
ncbi:MAG: copper-binding protein [Rhodospirillaceae bacterium]|nr:MAG: copper-binding protein [Rhodospirillaceae bacterium]